MHRGEGCTTGKVGKTAETVVDGGTKRKMLLVWRVCCIGKEGGRVAHQTTMVQGKEGHRSEKETKTAARKGGQAPLPTKSW